MSRTIPFDGRPWTVLSAGAVLTLVLAACSAASLTPTASLTSTTGSSGIVRCAVTPDASPNATIEVPRLSFGPSVTISVGQVVVFTNGIVAHTITEGSNGKAAADACVDVPIAANQKVTVTFNEPGGYQITCKTHPFMHTSVHVQ